MKNKKKVNPILLIAVTSIFLFAFVTDADAQKNHNSNIDIESHNIDDIDITNAINFEMKVQAGVPVDKIDVTTLEGIVTLSGEVNDLLAKERANKIAQMVRGVRGTVNMIKVKRGLKTDNQIEKDIISALLMDPATESYQVNVSVFNGETTLSGNVDSWQEKNLVEKVVKSIQGVTDVTNELQFNLVSNRVDSEIETEIKKALHWNMLINDGLIEVDVKDGEVTLSGIVGSLVEKSRAIENSWVEGVKKIYDSNLVVEPLIKDKEIRDNKYVYKTDTEIKKAVKDAFVYDPRVISFNPEVKVDNGKVTLTGRVNNLKAKRAAEATALNIVGVWKVENLLKVRADKDYNDVQIENNIEKAIDWNTYLIGYEVDASVNDGKVYLTGNVDTYFEKFKAEEVASKINGVNNVVNKINVDTYSTPYVYDYEDYTHYPFSSFYETYGLNIRKNDQSIKDEIESQLWWSPYVNRDKILVSVDDGKATLAGTVDSWNEYYFAEQNAYEGGAISVDNDLIISSQESN